MKNQILFMASAAIATVLTSCQPQPSADFSTDKSQYVAGETVHLTNESVDATKYKWTFPDGQTATSENMDYTINENQQDANLTFKLEAISNNGKKTDDATKTVSVTAATGQLMVWTANSNVNFITVNINNVNSGTITSYYTGSAPDCGSNGCVTSTLTVGTYTIDASDGNYTWSGTMSVSANRCSIFQLQ